MAPIIKDGASPLLSRRSSRQRAFPMELTQVCSMVGSLRGHPGPPVSEQRKHTWTCAVRSPKFTVARTERTSGGPLLGEGRQLFQNMFLNFPSLPQMKYFCTNVLQELAAGDTPKQLLLRFLFLRDTMSISTTCHCHPSRTRSTRKDAHHFPFPPACDDARVDSDPALTMHEWMTMTN
jgi:hypothetical protein